MDIQVIKDFSLTAGQISAYGTAITVAVVTVVLAMLVRSFLVRNLKKLTSRVRQDVTYLPISFLESFRHWFFWVLGIELGLQFVDISEKMVGFFTQGFVFLVFLQLALCANSMIKAWAQHYEERNKKKNPSGVMTISALAFLGQIVVWILAFLLILDNFGVDITALVAGLGIGGIAVALALQNILGDLFASLSIVLDKPFVIGDFIITDDYMGTVEDIGLKTTRIRSLSGEQLVISNTDLLSSRIRNYKRMKERRIIFAVGVEYGIPAKKLEKIPGIIRKAIEKQQKTRFDRCHFKAYGDFSLNYETVFYVEDPAYATYMDIQQAVNLEIYRQFEKEKIGFAFPTRTVHLQGTVKSA